MNPRRLWAVARKEFIHVARDPRSLILSLAIPVLLLVIFGYALTLDVDDVPLAVWDQSRTPASRGLIADFEGSRYFRIAEAASSYRDIESALDRRKALAALVIPPDFSADLGSGRRLRVQFILDGTDPSTAAIALAYAQAVAAGFGEEVAVERAAAAMARPAPASEARARVWFNEALESRNSILPGLIAVIMMVIAALLTSLTVAREWEQGTMETLVSTPVRGMEVIIGKLAPYFAIGMADVLVAMLMGEFVFGVPLRGNGALLYLLSGVFLVGALSMGAFISILAKSQLLANQLAMILTFLPAFLLSGFVFPIENMPKVLQAVSFLVPSRHFIRVLHGIYLKGLGFHEVAVEMILLSVFAAAVLAASFAVFRKRIG